MASLPGRPAPKTAFKKGNKAATRRRVAVDARMFECMLEGVRLAEENFDTDATRIRLEREGKEAEEVNAILADLDGMDGRSALIHYWKRLTATGTDAANKIIADRLLPKPRFPAINLGKEESPQQLAAKICDMMVTGKLAPDHAEMILRGLNNAAELKEREIMIQMAALEVKAMEKGLLDDGEED